MNTSPPPEPGPEPPTYADVVSAAERIAGHAVVTPLLESPLLNERLGGRLLVKAECLQRSGAFKFRGAYNRISRLDDKARKAGVVAFSSGNHAQGVAMVAQMLGVPATIVMPTDAPEIKLANTRAYGAEVVLYDREKESREEIGERLAAEKGATLVPSYDDPFVIAGQGTVGLELGAQAEDMGARLDAVLIPCGGGGLSSGCALALSEICPEGEPVGTPCPSSSGRAVTTRKMLYWCRGRESSTACASERTTRLRSISRVRCCEQSARSTILEPLASEV